jgi:hypothetical protein
MQTETNSKYIENFNINLRALRIIKSLRLWNDTVYDRFCFSFRYRYAFSWAWIFCGRIAGLRLLRFAYLSR